MLQRLLGMLSFVLCLARAVHAGEQSVEAAREGQRTEAKATFEQGVLAYREGRYLQAAQHFLEADRLAPSSALSFNIAKAYEQLGDTSGALRWYRDYLRRAPSAHNATMVSGRIEALSAELSQRGLQQLTVLSVPQGATIAINGRTTGTTPQTFDLVPGQHRVSAVLRGYVEEVTDVVLDARTPRDVTFNLRALPSQRPGSAPATLRLQPVEPAERSRFGAVPWVVTGAGIALLGGAFGYELARRGDESAAEGAENQVDFKEHTDAMKRHQMVARVLVSVGGALVVTGGVFLLLNDQPSRLPQVGVGCNLGGCAAGAWF
jgi:tetratricopeptide (TPR) repeat protein